MARTNLVLIFAAALALVRRDQHTARSEWSLSGCPEKCGNVRIPYPFGVGKGCYYNRTIDDELFYSIDCTLDETSKVKKPSTHGSEVVEIDLLEGRMRLLGMGSHECYAKNGTLMDKNLASIEMERFSVPPTENVFVATGCDTYAWFEGIVNGTNYHSGCMTKCDSPNDVVNFTCSGFGCCQMPIPEGITNVTLNASSFAKHTKVLSFNPCSSAYIVAKDALNFSLANLTGMPEISEGPPLVFDWVVGTETCKEAQASGSCLCKAINSTSCIDTPHGGGYRCKCRPGYTGNPYLDHGCQDIDECYEGKDDCEKHEYCKNTIGSFYCKCPKGFHGNGTKTDRCVQTFPTIFKVTIGVCGGIIGVTLLAVWVYWQHEKRQLKKAREDFFKQNGGHLLLEKLSSKDGSSVEPIKIFTNQELEKATNKFGTNNIIGKGGFGVVYKGMLSNNQEVAIKKSLKVDPKQNEDFINEVIVLSRLNNRHVVKLLGCLETEVPLLVYEFINNGTLHEHLHDEIKALELTWDIRLRIATEVAEVLSYLHDTISVPIIHRDMKSTNILLDRKYTAKVSDFGASRLIPIDQHQLATMVLGTCGYLDPEYLQTSELTQKSDVYSFGVVLAELLTRERALSYDRVESERCLAIFFLRRLKENRLNDILDDKIPRDNGALEQLQEVANLARRCLRLKGDDRPTMKEVAMELQRLKEEAVI